MSRCRLAIIFAVVLAACGGPLPPPVALRVCHYATQDFLPYFVMQEQGFAPTANAVLAEAP